MPKMQFTIWMERNSWAKDCEWRLPGPEVEGIETGETGGMEEVAGVEEEDMVEEGPGDRLLDPGPSIGSWSITFPQRRAGRYGLKVAKIVEINFYFLTF